MAATGVVFQAADGSWCAPDGRTLIFSERRFLERIWHGNHCFVCGVHPDDADFNEEHVIPNWLLKRFQAHQDRLRLPNEATVAYGRHKVPCCVECNSRIGREIEQPVSDLLASGFYGVLDHVQRKGPWLLFEWLCLLFVKVHLADKSLRWNLDARQGDQRIADAYAWEHIQHAHRMARRSHTGMHTNLQALGSFWVVSADDREEYGPFDFGTYFWHRSVMLRHRGIALVAILDDSGAAQYLLRDKLLQVTGPIYPHQHRELAARLGHLNKHLRNRPVHHPHVDTLGRFVLSVEIPEDIGPGLPAEDEFRSLLESSVDNLIAGVTAEEKIRRAIQTGFSFLFDKDGRYRSGSWVD